MCQTIILSHRGSTVISQCMECKAFTIWHHNLLLSFTPQQFDTFKNFTVRLDIEQSLFPFPNGDERLVLRTPNQDICFSFSADEWNDFQFGMEEATYMQNIYEMMY